MMIIQKDSGFRPTFSGKNGSQLEEHDKEMGSP
jgi:hypothetical protein